MTEEQQRIEAAIDNLLFDERRTLQRIDVETLVDAYRRACIERDELGAQLAAAQAKLDAVPVEAIRMLRMDAVPDYWIEYAEISDGPASELLNSLDAWLETQVEP